MEVLLKNTKAWMVYLLLLAAGMCIYSNSLHSPFMMDDHRVFSDVKLKNLKFLGNSFLYPSHGMDQGEAFNSSGQYYRPMAYVICMLAYQAFGDQPFGYHLCNLFLFSLLGLMVYLTIGLIFKDRLLALLSSILFIVHPINVFFVDYNTSTVHTVRFIFMFLAVILFLKERKGVALVCFIIALLCHETSAVLPVYLLFVSVFCSKTSLKASFLSTWPFFLVLFCYLVFRAFYTFIPGHFGISYFNPAAFSKIIYVYCSKLLFPHFIFFCWNVLFVNTAVWLVALFLLLAGWYLLFRTAPQGAPFFCVTWMMIGFLPVTVASMSAPALGLIIEPQWLTFSSIGFFAGVALCIRRVYANGHKLMAYISLAVLLAGWGMIGRYNNWIWGDEIRYMDYWSADMEGHSGIQNNHLGDLYMRRGNEALARYYYLQVVRAGEQENLGSAYNNLGLIDLHQGHLSVAKEEFLSSLSHDPSNYAALNNLALIYARQGDDRQAKALLIRSLSIDRYALETRLNLAMIDEKESNDAQAEKLYQENLAIVPDDEPSLEGLLKLSLRRHDAEDIKRYAQLLIEHSRRASTLTVMGSQLASRGEVNLASAAFSQAIRLDPKYKDAYLEAGALLANAGIYDQAIRLWQMGGQIDPGDQRFKENISRADALKAALH